ncbi:hypothetical protein BKI52_15870 [marine bacterium AO1-C]|nr:hypothetical protein BKI52_15870 [marine bacterium AO1-C]
MADNTINREKRIQQDLKAVKELAKKYHRWLAIEKIQDTHISLRMILNLRTLIRVNAKSITPEFNDPEQESLIFKIELSSEYPETAPKCYCEDTDSPIPFHPHLEQVYKPAFFSRGVRRGFWRVDEDFSSMGLADFIVRLMKSLTFQEGFISDNEDAIMDKDAYQWYQYQKEKNTDEIPTDPTFAEFFSKSKTTTEQAEVEAMSQEKEAPALQVPRESNRTPRKKKFAIKSRQDTVQFIQKPEETFEGLIEDESNSKVVRHPYRIYLAPKAVNQITKHIGWGENRVQYNRVEQGGILLGKIYQDKATGTTYGVAHQAIAGHSARGNAVALEMTHETWKMMIDEADKLLENNSGLGDYIIGWYHTHPNTLDVFMSGTDRNTQRLFFNQDWHFAIVLNPHREIWKAFQGAEATECMGYTLKTEVAHGDDLVKEHRKDPACAQKQDSTKDSEELPPAPEESKRKRGKKKKSNFKSTVSPSSPIDPKYLVLLLFILFLVVVGFIGILNYNSDSTKTGKNKVEKQEGNSGVTSE